MSDTIMKIDHISKFYPGVTALNDVSFEIKKGEVRALCGENGAGKSTLIKCIMGVEKPDKGTVSMNYDGQWVVNENALEAQSHLQDFSMVLPESCLQHVYRVHFRQEERDMI